MDYFYIMVKHISSLQNPTIKRLLQLQEKSRARKKEGGFIIEGRREVELAIAGDFQLLEVYYHVDLITEAEVLSLINQSTPSLTSVSSEVYEKVAYRAGTEGVIAFAKAKNKTLADLDIPENSLILVAEAPEKPGNIGALLRTADAAGVDAVIIANPRTDLYNPNIIRSSVGCVFTNQIATGSTDEVIAFLQQEEIAIFSAILQDAVLYNEQDYKKAAAIVVGTEADGLSESWRKAGTSIKIPMCGSIDSMNVSVAAGILIFEARKQRS